MSFESDDQTDDHRGTRGSHEIEIPQREPRSAADPVHERDRGEIGRPGEERDNVREPHDHRDGREGADEERQRLLQQPRRERPERERVDG